MKKRLVSFLMVLICLVAVLPVFVSDAYAVKAVSIGDKIDTYCGMCSVRLLVEVSGIAYEATCTSFGYCYGYCPVCGTRLVIYAPEALGHSWTETRTEPTCTASGSIIKTCSRCTITEESETIPALDHDWKEFSRTDPTCTDPGSVTYQCSRCDFAKSESIPALGKDHTWEETNRTEPTATVPGSAEYTCSTCGASKTESLPPLGPGGSDLTMTSLLAKMTDVFTVVLSWVGVVSQTVAANPILLLCVVVGFIGTGVLLFKRLLNI